MQLVVNGSSMEEDDLQPPDDIGGNEDVVHPFASNADRLMMNPSCNHWLEELDIPEILKEEITRCICSKLRNFLELRWRYYPWEHEEDKEIVDGLEDIRGNDP